MLATLRQHIPFKPLLKRAVVDPLRRMKADRELDRAIAALRAGGKDLKALKRGWSNEGFEGDVKFLEETLARVRNKRILECGTGLTTIIAGLNSGEVWSLEQDDEWAQKVMRAMDRNRISAHIIAAPLREYEGYVWYDLTGLKLPLHYDLVICDGPYVNIARGSTIYQAWRYGVLPQMKLAGMSFKEMLIDDLDEKRSGPILERWGKEFGLTYQPIRSSSGDCAVARMAA